MTSSKDSKLIHPSLGSQSKCSTPRLAFADCTEVFLSRLREASPSSTFQSQKQTLSLFSSWTQRSGYCRCEILDLGSAFIEDLAKSDYYAIDTICGHARNLSNYIAYFQQEDPEVITARVFHNLGSKNPDERVRWVRKQLFGILNEATSPSGCTTAEIEEIFQRITRTQYGSRLHVFTEIIRETHARPNQVRALNVEDFKPENSTLQIGIREDSLLCQSGLTETREANVSNSLIEVLTEYIDEERKRPSSTDTVPLLTTSRGRVSASTIRRELKSTSETNPSSDCIVPDQVPHPEGSSQSCHSLLPSDIWWHSLSTITRDPR